MRIYQNAYELMSEMGRDLWEMGLEKHPKSMQNKNVANDDNFKTKELICQQYCLTSLKNEDALFVYSDSKKWAKAELEERLGYSATGINPGNAYKIREEVWDQFLNSDFKFDYTYNERIHSQDMGKDSNFIYVIMELQRNPDTRQAILPIFRHTDVQYIGGKRRIPCTMYYNFMMREDANGERVLHICYHQRSSDFVTHFGNDVWLAFKLMEKVAMAVGCKPGYLYHTIDSLHSYKKDWVKLKTSVRTQL